MSDEGDFQNYKDCIENNMKLIVMIFVIIVSMLLGFLAAIWAG
jgi:hypothetical protein